MKGESEMSIEEIKTMYHEGTAAFNRGDLDEFFSIFSPDYLHHNADLPEIHTLDEFKPHLARFMAAFPGLQAIDEDLIVEGTPEAWMVAGRTTYHFTSPGNMPGFPPGQSIEFHGIDIYRIVDGKVVEGWQQNDIVPTIQKLGLWAKA
jgi:predicted ester cyclase